MQKYANPVELEKCCQTHIFLQNFVLIQPRTSPPKIAKFCRICKILQIHIKRVRLKLSPDHDHPDAVLLAEGHPVCRGMRQTLEGSFSAVSKPNFASKYALESSRRDLHNALLCTAPKSHFFQKFAKICENFQKCELRNFSHRFLRKILDCSGAKGCKSCRA